MTVPIPVWWLSGFAAGLIISYVFGRSVRS